MNEINIYIGGQIRKYRKANGMTLQQLADVIHKSRATVCKYENGEISIDIATLYEISQALQISFGQLASYQPPLPPYTPPTVGTLQRSPFFQAKRLYFYFYDGRYHRLKDGVIDIHEHAERPGTYVASFTLCSVSGNGCSNETGSACRKPDQEHCRQSRRWWRRTSKYGTGGRQKSGWYFGGDRRGKNST